MDFAIVWTEPALQDLEALVRFIARDDAAAAIRVGDEIVNHVGILATFPEIGPVYRRRPAGEIRQITCRPFRYSIERIYRRNWLKFFMSGTELEVSLMTFSCNGHVAGSPLKPLSFTPAPGL